MTESRQKLIILQENIQSLYQNSRLEEAEELSLSFVEQFPSNPFGWKVLGGIYQQTDRVLDALNVCKKVIAIDPLDAAAHNNFGLMLGELGRLEESEASYRKAIEIKPDLVEARINLGNTLSALGRLKEAGKSFLDALKLEPSYAVPYNNLGNTLRELSRLDEAEKSYRKAIELNPDYAHAYNNLGIVLQKLSKFGESEANYRKAIAIEPEYPDAHHNLANILAERSKLEESEESYRKAIALKPDFAKAYNDLGITLEEAGRLEEAATIYRKMLSAKSEVVTDSERPSIFALLPIGRSGSLFFHSLLDGHPELATLPGPYFKGWFGLDIWQRFSPDLSKADWREGLTVKVVKEYQPLFDANCKRNVIGDPLKVSHKASWLAEELGFTNMGPDATQALVLDQEAFSQSFLELLKPLSSIGVRECFELIHQAFEIAIRGNTGSNGQAGGHLFYHIHNPGPYELGHFLKHYPKAKVLYIVRDPIQSLESWVMLNFPADVAPSNNSRYTNNELLRLWGIITGKVISIFTKLQTPFNVQCNSYAVKLEDVKRDADQIMPRIAEWMGISDHPSLYESSYCGLQYWGPASLYTGRISGFDTKAIDHEVGRFFGSRDILILETLFWPFSKQFGYTELDFEEFRRHLKEIRPWLDEPLEFEKKLYAIFPDQSRKFTDFSPYNRLHNFFYKLWDLLEREGAYKNLLADLIKK